VGTTLQGLLLRMVACEASSLHAAAPAAVVAAFAAVPATLAAATAADPCPCAEAPCLGLLARAAGALAAIDGQGGETPPEEVKGGHGEGLAAPSLAWLETLAGEPHQHPVT